MTTIKGLGGGKAPENYAYRLQFNLTTYNAFNTVYRYNYYCYYY